MCIRDRLLTVTVSKQTCRSCTVEWTQPVIWSVPLFPPPTPLHQNRCCWNRQAKKYCVCTKLLELIHSFCCMSSMLLYILHSMCCASNSEVVLYSIIIKILILYFVCFVLVVYYCTFYCPSQNVGTDLCDFYLFRPCYSAACLWEFISFIASHAKDLKK